MRWLYPILTLSMVCAGTLICDEQPATMAEQTVTAQDLDRQIRFLKDNIKKYTAMAKAFDRKASRLQSHDYNGYRAAAGVRDECQGIANDLQAHLAKLEKQRADMVEQQKTASQTKGE